MRIAFLLHQFPAISETFILRQIAGLVALGHDVRIFAESACHNRVNHSDIVKYDLLGRTKYLEAPSESVCYEMPVWPLRETTWLPDAGTPVSNRRRLLQCMPKLLKSFAFHPCLTREVLASRRYGYQAQSLSALYRLAALAEERTHFDVLHAHFGPVGKSFRFARKLWRSPLVVSFHGYDFSTWPRREGIDAYESLFNEVEIVTVHTKFAELRLRELGCPPRLLRRLECGIDLDEFRFRARQKPHVRPVHVLTVGRLVEKKGIEFSIRAIAQLLSEGYRLHYEIIGDGPLRNSLIDLACELNAADHITFSGGRDVDFVLQRMDESDLFVLASVTAADGDTEGAPVSLLEAQACGLPVVSTLHAGIPEIVRHNASGLLVPERDATALADALRQLLDAAQSWPDIGRKGREYVQQHHDLMMLNRRLLALYEEAIASMSLQ